MPKIIVIGCPGAGKSMFSRNLSNVMHLSVYHIDMLYHKKDGTHITKGMCQLNVGNFFIFYF